MTEESPPQKNTGPLPQQDKERFEMLLQGAVSGHLCIMAAIDKSTGKQVSTLCLAQREGDEIGFMPLGHLCPLEDPYEGYEPPNHIGIVDVVEEQPKGSVH